MLNTRKPRILILLICMMMLLNTVTVFSYTYPQEFWMHNKGYEPALTNKDYPNIIKYGIEILNVMKNAPEGPEKRQILASRYKEVALAYTELGEPLYAYPYFNSLLNLVNQYPNELESWRKLAERASQSFEKSFDLYTDKGTSVYYGAKHEKRNGVLYGTNADGITRTSGKIKDNESIVLVYQELGEELLAYNVGVFNNAEKSGYAVEYALNCPREGVDIENIKNLEWSLRDVSELLDEYPDVPVFLRFAAEFDVWTRMSDSKKFIDAFRYVSSYFKSRNSNVAIVWSPCQSSTYGVNVHDFYPGDAYVDWVGMSSYAIKYFCANKNQTVLDSLFFKSGDNSNPVIAIKDIVDAYGDRKPIMISESGVSHYVYNGINEDITDFAIERLREYYHYLPMVYPQIKAILYFDHYVSGGDQDYRLSKNTALQNEFLKITKGQRFIQDEYSANTDFCYRKITDGARLDGIFPVSCYAYANGESIKQVVYYIDGKYVGMSTELPFTTYINANAYGGNRVLKAIVTTKSGLNFTIEKKVFINGYPRDISVEISGRKVTFDQQPILYNSRTMVPMRKIFEELGATISWDENTKTITGKRGDRIVKVTVGSDRMYVNDKEIILDAVPIVLSDRTLVPVRAVAEGLGCDVKWYDSKSLVDITPKTAKWSEWDDELPDYVDDDTYYIQEKSEYRYRTRDVEYFTLDFKVNNGQYVRTETEYGIWSDWQDALITENDNREVERRTVSTPKKYHYAHYCTGWLEDASKKYRTSSVKWCDEAVYHELGWFDSKLPYSEDSTDDYAYYVNGEKYRCKNSCFRWYLTETEGGDKTQYRSRTVDKKYIHWTWTDWSRWSAWDEDNPYDYYDIDDDLIEVDERVLYRYKEM